MHYVIKRGGLLLFLGRRHIQDNMFIWSHRSKLASLWTIKHIFYSISLSLSHTHTHTHTQLEVNVVSAFLNIENTVLLFTFSSREQTSSPNLNFDKMIKASINSRNINFRLYTKIGNLLLVFCEQSKTKTFSMSEGSIVSYIYNLPQIRCLQTSHIPFY